MIERKKGYGEKTKKKLTICWIAENNAFLAAMKLAS